MLEEIQNSIYQKALDFRESNTTEVDTYDEFKEVLTENGGFVKAHWDGTAETENSRNSMTDEAVKTGRTLH